MSSVFNCTGHDIRVPDIVDSDGAWLVDAGGNRYLDLESGVWCLPLGHKHPRINAAMARQAESIAHTGFCYSSNIVEQAARSVLSIADMDAGQCVFLSSGSEAVELARQMCRHIAPDAATLCLHDAYFGSYSATTERGDGWFEFDWQECAICPDREDCKSDCPRLQGIPDAVSIFAFEPGSASGFVRFPPVSLIKNITRLIQGRGGKILVNEVTTGMGRTGAWFGCNHYEIDPDFLCMGKGLGNGYPVSALAINRRTAKELEQGTFRYMQSHQNDPMAAAIAHEVIAVFRDENLIRKAADKGKKFLAALQTLTDDNNIREVRGRGMIYGIDFVDGEVGDRIYEGLLKQGYIVCNRGGMFRIDPPLVTEEADFMGFVDVFRNLLAAEVAATG